MPRPSMMSPPQRSHHIRIASRHRRLQVIAVTRTLWRTLRHTIGDGGVEWGPRSSRPRPKVTLPATNRAYLAEDCPSAVVAR